MERAVMAAWRRRWGWYGEGSDSGTETTTGVVRRRQWQQHRGGDRGGMKRAVAAAWRWRWGWYEEGGGGGMETGWGWYEEGGSSSMETAMVPMGVVWRGRQRQHGDDDRGGTERVAAVAWRGWADGVGRVSLWAGGMLGL